MCLEELADFEVKQNWGWQCFQEHNNGCLTQRYSHGDNRPFTPVELDKWQTDPMNHHIATGGGNHQTGFHISLSQAGTKQHSLGAGMRKVYFRSIVAKGYQENDYLAVRYKTIVARERYVCDKTKRPPKD